MQRWHLPHYSQVSATRNVLLTSQNRILDADFIRMYCITEHDIGCGIDKTPFWKHGKAIDTLVDIFVNLCEK